MCSEPVIIGKENGQQGNGIPTCSRYSSGYGLGFVKVNFLTVCRGSILLSGVIFSLITGSLDIISLKRL